MHIEDHNGHQVYGVIYQDLCLNVIQGRWNGYTVRFELIHVGLLV